jgi:Penicillinase repressor
MRLKKTISLMSMSARRAKLPRPTDAERRFSGPLAAGTRTVRQVQEPLNQEKGEGYTTVLKVMQIMHEKGLLERDESARTHPMQEQFVKLGPHGVKLEHIRGLGSLGPGSCHPSLSRESNPGGRQTACLADCWSRFRQERQGKEHGLTAAWSLYDKEGGLRTNGVRAKSLTVSLAQIRRKLKRIGLESSHEFPFAFNRLIISYACFARR